MEFVSRCPIIMLAIINSSLPPFVTRTDTSQTTHPIELPIGGSVALDEIELKIESETHKYFQIQDKSLRLTRPLDRDAILKEVSGAISISRWRSAQLHKRSAQLHKPPHCGETRPLTARPPLTRRPALSHDTEFHADAPAADHIYLFANIVRGQARQQAATAGAAAGQENDHSRSSQSVGFE